MKLKKILFDIKEEFELGLDTNYGYVEVFKNPISQEIDLAKNDENKIRFVADPDKEDVYVWDAEVLHHEVCTELNIMYYGFADYLAGKGEVEGSKIEINFEGLETNYYNDDLYNSILTDIIKEKYDWMSEYKFDMKSLKNKARKIMKLKDLPDIEEIRGV